MSTTRTNRRTTALRVGGAALLAAVGLVALPASPAAAAATDGAYAEGAGLLIDTTLLAGNVPVEAAEALTSSSCLPQKPPATVTALGAGDAQVARADVLTSGSSAVCTGTGNLPRALGGAQLENVDALQITPAAIHVDSITTSSQTDCVGAPVGSTNIVGLTIAGQSVVPDGLVAPNTVVASPVLDLLGIRVILNEQNPAANGRGLVVNGIHIIASEFGTLPIGGQVIRGDIIISHAVSGVVCSNGRGAQNPTGVDAPDITFAKDASPTTVAGGTTVTYRATATNTSDQACEVLRFVDHLPAVVDFVSTSGPLGTAVDTPLPVRLDGGQDAILRPTGVTIAPKASVTQTFVVKVKAGTAPGTYYNNLELFCGPNGDFVSGPLAPITVPAAAPPPAVVPPVVPPVVPTLPRTGGEPLLALGALVALGAAVGARRFATR